MIVFADIINDIYSLKSNFANLEIVLQQCFKL
jgi:hypothetical protein